MVVKRATLHNYEEIEKLGLRIGDTVFIKRAGEVIPKVISVALKGFPEKVRDITVPENCPSCSTKIVKDEDKVRYYCPNHRACSAQIKEQLAYTVGKQGLNIDGFGEKQVALFFELGFIRDMSDIFHLDEKKDEILQLEGFKEKSVANLLIAIEKARTIDIATLLTALGIPGVGKKTAKTLAKFLATFSTTEEKNTASPLDPLLRSNFEDSRASTPVSVILTGEEDIVEELENLQDIGPEIARSVVEYF
ncbi:MAG: hypothetical protein H6767_00570 [Candidatus Peribacteria bacterium]|nr:MAG: hypothetical protein H6767_00570 [Candidatus Peribacteria bacterium]